MGVVITGQYVQGLSMEMTHELSGVSIVTDPPLDNGGQGASFSPTDLIATGLGSCMMSIVAIQAKKDNIDLKGMSVRVEKHMSADLPRRIVKLDVDLTFPASLPQDYRLKYIAAAENCPVIHSLEKSMAISKNYHYR
ncbi:MAG: OsmC family protein [Proteobacteria bacterium]|nr:OsmC family protein [Pseudomonadota bacterium]